MHKNETFVLTWDPAAGTGPSTRVLYRAIPGDVADGSGTFTSPYAITSQYFDAGGSAANKAVFAGGCIDFGVTTGGSCQFASTSRPGNGHDYPAMEPGIAPPADGTMVRGAERADSTAHEHRVPDRHSDPERAAVDDPSDRDARPHAARVHAAGRAYDAAGVVDCLDSAGNRVLRQRQPRAQSEPVQPQPQPARALLSYHSVVNVGGTNIAYVVQPWAATPGAQLGCDDPAIDPIPANPKVTELAADAAMRLVSPLSQARVRGDHRPRLERLVQQRPGSEINDNGCVPVPQQARYFTVGNSGQNPYFLQRESNNAGAIENDPNALSVLALGQPHPDVRGARAPSTGTTSSSSTARSDRLIADRSRTPDYQWNFGDGTTRGSARASSTATPKGGNYNV